jgi:Bifunctional DNA primase/polymerase, N-terminal/Primase C terminal 1 (PriCT-1)
VNGIFRGMQPVYAEHGIATFPVGRDKKPAIIHYQRLGLRGSGQLVARHAHAIGLGFTSNARNRIAVLDYDDTDERGFADALSRHGDTPIKVKTASGKYHAYYRHNGERRLIRGLDASPIDVLGSGGFAVAPPSAIPDKGTYQFIEGGLDDLDRLPVMKNLPSHVCKKQDFVFGSETIPEGKRNDTLWRQCMREARLVNSFDALLLAARAFNEACSPPLHDGDVVRTARSAWNYEENGLNRFGHQGAWIPGEEYDELLAQPDGLVVVNLLAFLRRHQGPRAEFMCTNDGVAQRLKCPEKRVAAARRRLIELGYIKPTRRAGRGVPALFVWSPKKGRSYD